MKATDLRIGNLYQWLHEEHETIEVVDIDFLKRQEAYDIDPEDEVFCRGWWARPIPLDEEWLLKLGFIKEIIADDVWYIHEQGDMMISGDRMYLSNNEFSVKEMPVHRLQNLYFFFHNEELTINDNEQ